jgi:hypothetical protein
VAEGLNPLGLRGRTRDDRFMSDRWGTGGPPPEAYSRMSVPDRYAELHPLAVELAQQLSRRHEVQLHRESVLDPSREASATALQLVPANPRAVRLTLVLTGLPGLEVRVDGRPWLLLPHCGCDACDETAEECRDQLEDLVTAAVAGSLGERVYRSAEGWQHERWIQWSGGGWSSRGKVDGVRLTELQMALPGGEARWEPWAAR